MKIDEAKKLLSEVKSGKQKVLKMDDKFKFGCTKCGKCCFGNEIILNIYDLIRLRNATKLSTTELIDKNYINVNIGPSSGLPVASIKFEVFKNTRLTKCPFLDVSFGKKDITCNVHKDRPMVCRTFPCGRIKQINEKTNKVKSTWILQDIDPEMCPGMLSNQEQTLREFLNNSEFYHFDEGSAKFHNLLNIIINKGFFAITKYNKKQKTKLKLNNESPEIMMLANILYNFDSFTTISGDSKCVSTITNENATHEDYMYVFNKIEELCFIFINKVTSKQGGIYGSK